MLDKEGKRVIRILSAKEILENYRRLDMTLPNDTPTHEATEKNVFRALDRIRARLLEFLRQECQSLFEAMIDRDIVKALLEAFGAQAA
jgi:hypothetical protein